MRGVIIKESDILDKALRGEIDKKPMTTLRVLAKYYFICENDKEVIENKLNTYMKENYIGYKPSKWKPILGQLVKSVSKYDSFEIKDIDYIEITEGEWNKIIELNNKQLEKLAFILLVYSKINNIRVTNNDNRVNQNITDIFSESHIKMIEENKTLLNILFKKGYLSQGKSCDATAIKVEFGGGDKIKFKVESFANVITYYDEYKNNKKYIKCECCEKRILVRGNRVKYCNVCSKDIKRLKNKDNMKKYRNVVK